MAMRYLRRPPKPKPSSRKPGALQAGRAAAAQDLVGPVAQPMIEVAPDEREKLAQALAYFCVACGREHASSSVRCNDVACAEAEIIAVISRAQ